jgi:hypothetical protein
VNFYAPIHLQQFTVVQKKDHIPSEHSMTQTWRFFGVGGSFTSGKDPEDTNEYSITVL